MTKVRVHDLAKELNKTNKEVLDVLRAKNIEVTSHMSSLSDEQIGLVKSSLGGGETKEEPKKKNIVQVFRPQNSQNGSRQGNRPTQRRDGQTTIRDKEAETIRGKDRMVRDHITITKVRKTIMPVRDRDRIIMPREQIIIKDRTTIIRAKSGMTTDVMTEETTAEMIIEETTEEMITERAHLLFRHRWFRSRSHSVRNKKIILIRRKIIAKMTMRKECRKGKKQRMCRCSQSRSQR